MDDREYSPELQRKLAETAARAKSFAAAEELARIWSGVAISSRHLGRVVEAIGEELVELRDAETDDFTHHRRGPEGPDPEHELAAVFVDGGRVQIRDETWGVEPGPGEKKKFWREDKVARCQTMTGVCHPQDPCPEPPRCFLDAAKLESLSNPAEPRETPENTGGTTPPPPIPTPGSVERWTPEPLVRTCVATMRSIEDFRWMVQAEAKKRHFFTAEKRAFVADGLAYNWTTLHAKHFPDFVPILDFLHVAGYLHAAAKALGSVTLGCHWIREVWQGRAAAVAGELGRRWTMEAPGESDVPKEHPLRPVRDAAHYLTTHADKVDYPRYRREGLPCTSSLIESQIKEFNARVKGTEKFWDEENAEAMLQLIAWTLREDGPTLRDHLESRPGHPFRRRSSHANPVTIAV